RDFADPDYRVTFIVSKIGHQALSVINHGGKLVATFRLADGAFELPDTLRSDLEKSALDFRERKVLKLDANVIDRVDVDGDTYQRENGVWKTSAGEEASHLQALVVDLEFAKTN